MACLCMYMHFCMLSRMKNVSLSQARNMKKFMQYPVTMWIQSVPKSQYIPFLLLLNVLHIKYSYLLRFFLYFCLYISLLNFFLFSKNHWFICKKNEVEEVINPRIRILGYMSNSAIQPIWSVKKYVVIPAFLSC